MKEEQLSAFRRRKIGFVFQSYNLISSINVWENIVLPLGLDHKKVDTGFVGGIIDVLSLNEKTHNMPNTLSGGQQQRVATGNLDSKTSLEVMSLLKTSVKRYGQTLIMITHDEELAQMADRILTIEDGLVINDSKIAAVSAVAPDGKAVRA